MRSRTVYQARVAVAAAGLEKHHNLQETCCVVSLKHEEIGSDLLLQEACSGWRAGSSPVFSDTSNPFTFLVGDGELAAVSDASLLLTLYGRVAGQKQAALFSCLAQPVTAVEVLLQQELPLQEVLMAASMSRVQQLQLRGGGSARCEVALSHPQRGGALLAAVGGGRGLRVVDQEERRLWGVQAVRTGPQRTSQEAKRRQPNQGAGSGSWVATDAAGRAVPAASPAYELQVMPEAEADAEGADEQQQQQQQQPAGTGGHGQQRQPSARCRMDPGAERYTVLVSDEGCDGGYSCWATLAVQQLAGRSGRAALQLSIPTLPHVQLASRSITPAAATILSDAAPAGAAAAHASRMHPNIRDSSSNSSNSSSAGAGSKQTAAASKAGCGTSGAGVHSQQTAPAGVRYELRAAAAGARRSLEQAAPARAAGGSGGGGTDGGGAQGAADPLASIAVAARLTGGQQEQGAAATRGNEAGGDDAEAAAPVFVVDWPQPSAVAHEAGLVCLAALLAELT